MKWANTIMIALLLILMVVGVFFAVKIADGLVKLQLQLTRGGVFGDDAGSVGS